MSIVYKLTLQSFYRFSLVSVLTFTTFLLTPSTTLAKDVVLVLEESSIAQGKNGMPAIIRDSWGQSILNNSPRNSDLMKVYHNSEFAYVEWGIDTTPESLAADIESKVGPNDRLRTIVVSAHGNPRLLVFGNEEKFMTGGQFADHLFASLKSVKLSPELGVYIWSCMVGCKIGEIPSFQDEFFNTAVQRLSERSEPTQKLDVLGHLSYSWTSSKTLKPLTGFSRLTFASGFTKLQSTLTVKGLWNDRIRNLVSKNKLARFLIVGNDYVPPLAGTGVALAASSMALGIALTAVDFNTGLALMGTSSFLLAIAKPTAKTLLSAAEQYSRLLTFQNGKVTDRRGTSGVNFYELLPNPTDTLFSQLSSQICFKFYGSK